GSASPAAGSASPAAGFSPPAAAAANADPQGGGRDRIDGRYDKIKAVGSGGIGTVYLARQVFLGRDVALKEVKELFGFFTEPQRQEMARRFDAEVRNAAGLSHPNIVSVIDGNTSREHPYVVTEFVTGGSLRRILTLAEKIPPELSVKIFLQILHGLGHAHSHGVLHRSLKPENILFDDAGNVRITDFGMARIVERDQAVIKHVYVGMGSVAYMAPELFSDPANVGVQTDLYALGILLYEMLARKLPGRRSPMPTKLHPTLPKIIDDVFDKLTQDEQGDRYKTVDEVLEDFYKSDSVKPFMEPRGAIYFTESPLDSIELKAEEVPKAEEPAAAAAAAEEAPSSEDASASASAPRPMLEAATPTLEAGRGDPEASTPSPVEQVEEVPPEHLDAGDATGVARIDLAEDGDVEGVEALAMAEGGGDADVDADVDVDVDVDDEDGNDDGQAGDGKRRRRRNRPYSFQQRMKERDK
ncbi:MAG: serine/threonine protein kinase, partial [Deltaproteobacteria bacterium]|nr:serine/threonine protein kinase [Deltaproteobacteria bacterium]